MYQLQVRLARMDIGFLETPGISLNLYAQGCSRNCEGCHNPELHDFNGGSALSDDVVYLKMKQCRALADWVCFLGGDFFYQRDALEALSTYAKSMGYNTCLYTGALISDYTPLELRYVDKVIDGSYKPELATSGFPASSNQRVWTRGIKGEWQCK